MFSLFEAPACIGWLLESWAHRQHVRPGRHECRREAWRQSRLFENNHPSNHRSPCAACNHRRSVCQCSAQKWWHLRLSRFHEVLCGGKKPSGSALLDEAGNHCGLAHHHQPGVDYICMTMSRHLSKSVLRSRLILRVCVRPYLCICIYLYIYTDIYVGIYIYVRVCTEIGI